QLALLLAQSEGLSDADRARWEQLRNLADEPGVTDELFTAELRKAIQDSPHGMLDQILDALIRSSPEGQRSSAQAGAALSGTRAAEERRLRAEMEQAERATRPERNTERALTALGYRAFHTARALLDSVPVEDGKRAPMELLRAYIECMAQLRNPHK